ncbi:MAG: hypothetical protein RRY29_04150 [Desulfovibrionaceae bacterium]
MRKCLYALSIIVVVYIVIVEPLTSKDTHITTTETQSAQDATKAAENTPAGLPEELDPITFTPQNYALMYTNLNEVMQENMLNSIIFLIGRGKACNVSTENLDKKLNILLSIDTTRDKKTTDAAIEQQMLAQKNGTTQETCENIQTIIEQVEKKSRIID